MKILLLGASGQVGWELQRSLAPLGEIKALNRKFANLEDVGGLRTIIDTYRPDVIVNAAAYTAVDKAETEPEMARRVNADAVAVLAKESKRIGAWLVHYSTDYVFDGTKATPYEEKDAPAPINVYGSSKLEGEEAIRDIGCNHLIFRTSWVYASRGQNFIKTMLRMAADRETLNVVADQFGAPTHAELISDVTAHALHQCMIGVEEVRNHLIGTYHLVAGGETNWCDYARYVISLAEEHGAEVRVNASSIKPILSDDYPVPASRPKNSRLSTVKIEQTFNLIMPDWRYQVRRAVLELLNQG